LSCETKSLYFYLQKPLTSFDTIQKVYWAIMNHGPISRKELDELLEMPRSTVWHSLDYLVFSQQIKKVFSKPITYFIQ
jgi:predicted transcriptional regulator